MADGTTKIDDGAPPPQPAAAPAPVTAKKVLLKPKSKPKEREQSTIAFPYMSLDAGVSVALAIIGAGGVAITREQLAGLMGQSVGSGAFVTKVATARLFGLIKYDNGKYELTDIGFSIVDSDEKRQRAARATAFLNVPLYRRVYDEFRGKQLPPRPHGLEQAFVKFGVAPKQRTNARLAFDKSAKEAGFFPNGADRLIEPIIGYMPSPLAAAPVEDERTETGPAHLMAPSGLHPFILGLLDTLPEPGTNWTIEGRAKWLQAAARCFDLMYAGDGEIEIVAQNKTTAQ